MKYITTEVENKIKSKNKTVAPKSSKLRQIFQPFFYYTDFLNYHIIISNLEVQNKYP